MGVFVISNCKVSLCLVGICPAYKGSMRVMAAMDLLEQRRKVVLTGYLWVKSTEYTGVDRRNSCHLDLFFKLA